ncbi:MAG: hypothetical protein RL719_554 [Actinomycetota bacterium]
MSISSILNKMKKTVTTLVGAALVAGSLVATTPASAADVSTMKQPKDLVSLGSPLSDWTRNGDLVVRGGWVYAMQPVEQNYWYGSNLDTTVGRAALTRTKLSTFASSTPKVILPLDHSATASSTATSGSVSSTYDPQAMDVTPDGNTAFIVDKVKDQTYKIRIIKVDLSAATGDNDTNLTGEVVATKDNMYSYVAGITAISDSAFIFNYGNNVSKVTLSGSTWTFGSTFANSIYDVQLNKDGNLVTAQASSTNVVLTVYNPSTMAVIGSASTVALGTNNYPHTAAGIALDPSNGDVLVADKDGTRVRRAVFNNGSFDATAKYEALQGAKSITATAMTSASGNYTFTVPSTTGVVIGSTVALGQVQANEPMAYINTSGSYNTMTVTATTATSITVSANQAPLTVNGGTLKSAELFVKKPLVYLSALAFDGSVGGVGLLALDKGTSGNTTPAIGPSIMSFEAHALPGVGTQLNLNQYHKSFNLNYLGPAVSNDIKTYEAYLFSGATLDAAVAAAQAHTTPGSPACTNDGNGYGSINFTCYIVDGLVTGTYYAVAVKQVAFDGVSSWTVPGATANSNNSAAKLAVDNTVTMTLPTDPDPAGPASPGFAHQGPTSTAALSLLGSAYQHVTQSDGQGGKYVAYKVSNTTGGEYKVIHIKNTGDVDTSFGTAGIQTLSAQASGDVSGNRKVQLSWYDDGKFVFSDYDAVASAYNFSFATANGTNGWTLTDNQARDFCATNVTGESSTSATSMTLVSAATTDPIVIVNCNVNWQSPQYQSINLSYPVVAKLTADQTLTLIAAPLSNINSYSAASTETDKVCLANWANQGVGIISDPNPGASGTLFTMLYRASAMSALQNGYRNCYGDMNTTYVGRSLTVKADGTFTLADNNVPTSNSTYPTVVGSAVTSGHNFYLFTTTGWNSTTKIFRLSDSGALDTTFGSQGSLTMATPTCAGTNLTTIGLAENNAGDVYLTNLSTNGSGSLRKVYATSQLLEKSNANTSEIGSAHISAAVGTSASLSVFVDGTLSDYGYAYTGTTIDAAGNAYLNYYSGSTGIKSIKFDSFAGALAPDEDYLDCPPAPFEAITSAAPFNTYNPGAVVKSSDTTFFMYNLDGTDKTSATFTFGSNLKGGTFSSNENSIDSHEGGFVVALGNGKVLVGGGTTFLIDQSTNWMPVTRAVRTVEIYDPSAAAGSRWTKLSDANGNNVLPDEIRQNGQAKLLANGKVLVYGGVWGMDDAPNSGPRTSGVVLTIGAAGASSVATVEFGASYTQIIPAGAGKWLLAGNRQDGGYLGITPVKTTKVFTEATNAVSAGPDLKSARRGPIVATLSNGKTMIAGDTCWGNCGMTELSSYDLYDPATNTIATTNNVFRGASPSLYPAFYNISGAIQLASGKVLLVPGTMGPSGNAWLMNTANNTFSNGDTPVTGLNNESLFLIGEKVLLAGGSGNGQSTPWQVYTQPVVVEPLTFIADNRRILKGSTGNLTISSSQIFDLGAQTPSDTRLTVTYSNAGPSNVLKAPIVVPNNKLKLDATKLKLTLALPTVAQMNAGAVGVVTATIKQGTATLGTVNINYIATKDTPVFQGAIQPGVVVNVPGMAAGRTLGLTAPVGNGTPVLTYKSNTTKICSVNPMGQVTRIARGECQIVVSQAADLGTNAASQTYKLNFMKSTVELAFANTAPAAGDIDLTEDDIPLAIVATVDGQPAPGLDVVFDVSADDKCAIDDDGVFNTLAVGSCVVTASFAATADFNAATSITRTYNIVVPSVAVEPEGTVGGVIGDAVFEAKDDATDTMLTVSTNVSKLLPKTIKLGRGWKIQYTPVVKNGAVTSATFAPSITSTVIGSITTTFIVPKAAFAKTPAGWKVVGTNYSCALAVYGTKTQVAANKKIKTVVSKGKTCALPALTAPIQVKVKNNWVRLGQKKGSDKLDPQRRTAKLNIQ